MVRQLWILPTLVGLLLIVAGAAVNYARAEINPALALFLGYSKAVNVVALASNGRQALSGGQDNVLRLWDIPTGLLLRTFDAELNAMKAVAFSPDDHKIATGGTGSQIRLWDIASGRAVMSLDGHSGEITSLAFSPSGQRVISASKDKSVKLWDTGTGQLVRSFEGHSGEVLSVVFSSDGRFALSGGKDKTLRLWDVETGQLLRTFEGHADAVSSVALSQDGRLALSGSDDTTLKLWNVETGQVLKTLQGHADAVLSVALSGDGLQALSASKDKTLKLWDTSSGAVIKTFAGHTDRVTSVAFPPDRRRALSGSWDKTLKLWDLQTGQLASTIDLQSVGFFPSGYRNFFSGVSASKRANPVRLDERLRKRGLRRGDPVFLRIFKGDLEAELWIKHGAVFELFATYPICAWSGELGPKLQEGDSQAPEGFYTIGKSQLNPNSHYHRAFNLGYPNAFDRAHKRTGTNLMLHGGCGSVGCYAMTDAQIDEVWLLATAALDKGQERIGVHVFPFRMTEERLAAFAWHPWAPFWRDLKPAYDFFEESHIPPLISVCGKRYVVQREQAAAGAHPVSQPACASSPG
ncbi:MAG: hypothetical protein WBX25_11200 [Rhodomicrobium sp.]